MHDFVWDGTTVAGNIMRWSVHKFAKPRPLSSGRENKQLVRIARQCGQWVAGERGWANDAHLAGLASINIIRRVFKSVSNAVDKRIGQGA